MFSQVGVLSFYLVSKWQRFVVPGDGVMRMQSSVLGNDQPLSDTTRRGTTWLISKRGAFQRPFKLSPKAARQQSPESNK
jgi:hypothetical protein